MTAAARASPSSEGQIQNAIRLALGRDPDVVLWRNSVGVAEFFSRGRMATVRYGLATGSADLVGLVRHVSGVGRFLALEVKQPGKKARPEQAAWLAIVRRLGGVGEVVTGVDQALDVVRRAKA